MEKQILSKETKDKIMRRVWINWAVRRSAPLVGFLMLLFVESLFVSFGSVFANAASATMTVGSFTDYWYSAFINTELYVLLGVIIFVLGGILFARSIFNDMQASNFGRERATS